MKLGPTCLIEDAVLISRFLITSVKTCLPNKPTCTGFRQYLFEGYHYSTFKVRRGGREKIPLIQGKEQRLHFAGAAVKRPHVQGKRNPSKTVSAARGHQRADALKP